MKHPLVIFGIGEMSQLAHYYFTTDSNHEVVAFTVDSNFIESANFCGLPVAPFEDIVNLYPPTKYRMFIAVGYSKLNQVRREKYLMARNLGYSLSTYLSSRSTIINSNNIGDNCFILEGSIIQPFVNIGNNVILWSGSHIGHHSTIHDHCFIAPGVIISGGVEVHESCFIGANATLRDHITVKERCVIGAGSLLLTDAKPNSVFIGKEAKFSKVRSTSLRKI